ncbi:AMP-binding protein [Streptomyces sp. NPDC058442]|uniref:AMP-binding protein n=1 Tax=Streptomyces sp. NPDC058442 TaxID=3346503 RepID=UPI0036526476
MSAAMTPGERFREARDLLLRYRTDYDRAVARFRWPDLTEFNWALDWFDTLAVGRGEALRIVGDAGPDTDTVFTFADLSRRSAQVAGWLRDLGVRRGDPLLVMLGNRAEVWETLLAAMKLGAVVVPTYTTATPAEIADRLTRGQVRFVIAEASVTGRFAGAPGDWTGISVGGAAQGWLAYEHSEAGPDDFTPDAITRAHDPLFRYFTSGTTSLPKMVEHTHVSYPVGHLSGMYWNGVAPGDLHLNISAPGWAKHAWSSFFVPWNAEATVVALDSSAATPARVLDVLGSRAISTFCAPPTVWRALAEHGLGRRPVALREAAAAGEPLEASLIALVRREWKIDLRDGFGQTETTAQIGNPPGRRSVAGSMGLPLPGYRIVLRDPETGREVPDGEPGEICVPLAGRPLGLMKGYVGDADRTAAAFAGGYYRSGDLAVRASDGSLTHLSRSDDMFKAFDHRISPRELEEVVRSHEAVADVAVVPVPDPVGLWAPKAFVLLAPGHRADERTAAGVFDLVRSALPPEKWVRAVEFTEELPRTSSGKVRRAALRERAHRAAGRDHLIDQVVDAPSRG